MSSMIGMRFSQLLVIGRASKAHGCTRWECKCDCGATVVVRNARLTGKARLQLSCNACARRRGSVARTTHGHTRNKTASRTFGSWRDAIGRCENPKTDQWDNYGARGIKVCERWHVFANFLADMGERPPGTSIDRINNNGNYEPGNCRWATAKQQARNTRSTVLVTACGLTRSLAEWSECSGIERATIQNRLKYGWDPSRAVTEQPRPVSRAWRTAKAVSL